MWLEEGFRTLHAALQPKYDTLREYVLAAPVIGADETWWRLLGGPESKRWWAWGVTREDLDQRVGLRRAGRLPHLSEV